MGDGLCRWLRGGQQSMARLNPTAACMLAMALSGCASVSVREGLAVAAPDQPLIIYVQDFDTESGEWNVDREGEELKQIKAGTQRLLSEEIARLLDENVAMAMRLGWNEEPPATQNAWLLRGRFRLVNQGSRALRTVVGFGAGGTKMETEVELLELKDKSAQPFWTFATTGGSNAEPGAIAGLGPGDWVVQGSAAAATGGGIFARGITEDTSRTARMIAGEISHYFFRQGWLEKERVMEVKHYED